MGKLTDSIHSYKRRLDARRLRQTAERMQRVLRTGPHRKLELDKLYDEFCRNKSVDL